MVELLLEKGADVNIQDKNGWTALDYAVEGWNNLDEEDYDIYDREDLKEISQKYDAIIEVLKKD